MKIELYSIPNCKHSSNIENFLHNNNIKFKKIIVNNEQLKKELKKISFQEQISIIKITRNHSINVINGFNESMMNMEIIEHIKKYKPKIEI
jgi:arsenate reductase-like glutaredoxin family protein